MRGYQLIDARNQLRKIKRERALRIEEEDAHLEQLAQSDREQQLHSRLLSTLKQTNRNKSIGQIIRKLKG